MPEGPTIVILKEEVQAFAGKKIIGVAGNTKMDKERLLNQTVTGFKSWGKHFLICFHTFTVRIHFMLFGSYRINERKAAVPRLQLQFAKGMELNFYTCSIQFIETPLDEVYDWTADVMNETWSPRKATRKLRDKPDMLVCDALLDQHIFAGVGNIIKNEVLFRIRVHPLSVVGKLPAAKLAALVKQARQYSFEFLEWKKAYVLKKHWLAHTRKICPRDEVPFHKEYLGKTHRRTFFCTVCQVLYGE
ncbi:DNA-formamidopyrimidine glycosylase family protein [Deminuibacter soli]|uniref:Endonuclease n=1 Tax=Deminuibacter soli TaxID=2291815 RepID=A0A3E1NPM9_9BACT|nr:DNA-formamidopyrimidine glycosylase family protein [Deminuibacter soli]RFM29857.1 endonuclease [Deminuibacter soli]